MALDPTLRNALSGSSLRTFVAVEIKMIVSGTIVRVIDGSGFVEFSVDGATAYFDGQDPVFGSVAGVTSIQERVASEAPTVSVTMMAMSPDAFGEINRPQNQGSPVRVWFGLVDDQTGRVIGVPELLWSGRLDTVQSTIGEQSQVCELITVSAFDRLFAANEGECLNPSWHQSIWPGETGLAGVMQATTDPMWGAEAPRPSVTPAGYYGGQTAVTGGQFGGAYSNLRLQ